MWWFKSCVFFCLLFTASINLSLTLKTSSDEEPEEFINRERLKHIRKLYRSYPALQLPFFCSDTLYPEIIAYETNEIDSLVFERYVGYVPIGTYPDTSSFFGFFYLTVGDDVIPTFISYDKEGRLIAKEYLATSCWKGCESDCRWSVKIDPAWQITFTYAFFEFECGDYTEPTNHIDYPISAEGFIRKSTIEKKGTIQQISLDSLSQTELMKNPIVHKE